MGPSGAGKSTLLNILAGYVTAGVKGRIIVNDRPRVMKEFNKMSAYIMQEDIVQPRLTVKEAMMFAASLKLGTEIGQSKKAAVKISRLDRTVICTIHQPPASLFQNFDQVYVVAKGYCVYNGSPASLVPFLSKAHFPCPSTYTPADYSK
ncbi:hypothetical protein YQE_01188, partial [Dendroctonus ponderosae]